MKTSQRLCLLFCAAYFWSVLRQVQFLVSLKITITNSFLLILHFSAVMSLFFNQKLGFDPSHSTALFHAYECLVFSFTIVGAIIADKYLGLYKTLVPTSFVYAAGAGIIAIAAIEPLNLPIK